MTTTARRLAVAWALSLPIVTALLFVPIFGAQFSTPKTFFVVFSAFVLGAWAFVSGNIRGGCPRSQRFFWWTVAAYLGAIGVSALFSPWPHLCGGSVVWWVSGFVLLWSVRELLCGNVRRLLVVISAAAVIVALLTLGQFLFGLDLFAVYGLRYEVSGRMRMYASVGNPAFVGAFLAAALPALLACCVIFRNRWFLPAIGAVVVLGAILVTGSRAGLVAAMASVMVLAALVVRGPLRFPVFAAVAFVCVAGLVFSLWNPRSLKEAARGRVFVWQVAVGGRGFAVGRLSDLLGNGPGTFAYLYPSSLGRFLELTDRGDLVRYAGHERHAENDFVEAFQESGPVGLLALITLLTAWFYSAVRIRRTGSAGLENAAAMAGVVSICTASLFDFPLHRAETWVLLMLWMAVPLALPGATESGGGHVPSGNKARLMGTIAMIVVGFAVAVPPAAADYLFARGEAFENRGEFDRAVSCYRSATLLWPNSPDAQFNLTRALAKKGELNAALKQSAEAARYVNEPELWLLRARILRSIGLPDQASRELRVKSTVFPYARELRDELQADYGLTRGK